MIRSALLVATVMVAACGFQLRTNAIDVDLNAVSIVAADAPIERDLRAALLDAGVALVEDEDDDADVDGWTIELFDQRSRAIPSAMTEDVRVNELDLEMSVDLSLAHRGEVLFTERVMIERPVRIDRDNLVSSREERRVVLTEMRAQLVRDIVRILDVVARATAEASR